MSAQLHIPKQPPTKRVVVNGVMEALIAEVVVRECSRVVDKYILLEICGFAGLENFRDAVRNHLDGWEPTERVNVFVSRSFPTIEAAMKCPRFSRMVKEVA